MVERRDRPRSARRGSPGWGALVGLTLACTSPPPAEAPPRPHLQRSDESLDGSLWLRESAEVATAAGAGPLQVLALGAGLPGDHLPALVNVPAGLCALLFARGGESVEDIDLFVYGDDGTQFGSDEATDAEPNVLVCVDAGTRLYVSARVAAGRGLVALGVQEVPRERAGAVARSLKVRGFGAPEPAEVEAWPGLGEAIAVHRRRMGGTWEDQRRVALPVDARVTTRVSAHVAAQTCLDALALTTEEVVQLDLEVLDETGRIFGRSQSGLPRSLLVCSEENARITYQLRPHQGRGLAVLALSSTRRGSEVDLDPEVPRALLIPPRLAGASQAKTTNLPRGSLRGSGRLGGRDSVTVNWPGGCGRFDVRSEGALVGIDALLWSESGDLLAQGEGLAEVPLFVCSPRGKLRLDVEATRRQGSFTLTPHPDRNRTPEALVAHPLAASRLLDRLHQAGQLEMPSRVGQVTALSLSPDRIQRMSLQVPVQRCLDVFLAVGPGATAAELRLVDAQSGRELELSRGPRSASARACAVERGTLDLIAELRQAGTAGTGLVATRLLGGTP